jgi:hypothetical protein
MNFNQSHLNALVPPTKVANALTAQPFGYANPQLLPALGGGDINPFSAQPHSGNLLGARNFFDAVPATPLHGPPLSPFANPFVTPNQYPAALAPLDNSPPRLFHSNLVESKQAGMSCLPYGNNTSKDCHQPLLQPRFDSFGPFVDVARRYQAGPDNDALLPNRNELQQNQLNRP